MVDRRASSPSLPRQGTVLLVSEGGERGRSLPVAAVARTPSGKGTGGRFSRRARSPGGCRRSGCGPGRGACRDRQDAAADRARRARGGGGLPDSPRTWRRARARVSFRRRAPAVRACASRRRGARASAGSMAANAAPARAIFEAAELRPRGASGQRRHLRRPPRALLAHRESERGESGAGGGRRSPVVRPGLPAVPRLSRAPARGLPALGAICVREERSRGWSRRHWARSQATR